jgi:Zn-dependent protease
MQVPMEIITIISIVILIMSAVVHEFAHGYAAYRLGDPTAQYEGRLTLNPIPHLDLFGSILLPTLLVLSGSPFVLGWAKPVPYNPYNLRNRRWGELIVAAAGPASNIIIALIAGIIFQLAPISQSVAEFLYVIVFINVLLCIFNLIPVPPLDGSKILFGLFPRAVKMRAFLEKYQLVFFLAVLFLVWGIIGPVVQIITQLITGIGI